MPQFPFGLSIPQFPHTGPQQGYSGTRIGGPYSIFTSSVYRTDAAEWLFGQEKATLHAGARSAREAKMLKATAFELTRPSGSGDPSRTFLGIAILVPL